MPNTWGAGEIPDEVADREYEAFKSGDYDDTPEVPVSWDTGELREKT